jgi:hypothetical protein
MRLTKRRAIRCVYCESLRTVKNGCRVITVMSFGQRTKHRVSRYRCEECERYFSLRRERGQRYSLGFKLELARMHVEERMSYRVMAKRIEERFGKQVSPRVLCGMVNEVAAHAKGSLAMREEYHPQWAGYLLVDDKYLSMRGRKLMSLVAADSTGDALHSEILAAPEQGEFTDFFRFIVERLEYPLLGLTTDFDERFGRSLEALNLGHILHQRCIWHGMQMVRRMLNHLVLRQRYWQLKMRLDREQRRAEDGDFYALRTVLERLTAELAAIEPEYRRQCDLLESLKEILYASDPKESRERFVAFRKSYQRHYPYVIAWLWENLELMLVHQRDVRIPKTNNLAENLNKQLERRFKTIEAFQSVETAWNYQNLIRNYLRFKPYTDCRGTRKIYNGKSPLEVCGVVLEHHDWVKMATSWS